MPPSLKCHSLVRLSKPTLASLYLHQLKNNQCSSVFRGYGDEPTTPDKDIELHPKKMFFSFHFRGATCESNYVNLCHLARVQCGCVRQDHLLLFVSDAANTVLSIARSLVAICVGSRVSAAQTQIHLTLYVVACHSAQKIQAPRSELRATEKWSPCSLKKSQKRYPESAISSCTRIVPSRW